MMGIVVVRSNYIFRDLEMHCLDNCQFASSKEYLITIRVIKFTWRNQLVQLDTKKEDGELKWSLPHSAQNVRY